MADKLLKSIKFPTLPDRYVIGDASLSEEGAAADAKATGDAIADLKDDIITSLTYTEYDGYINEGGIPVSPTSNAEKYTEKIPVAYGMNIIWDYSTSSNHSLWAAYLEYDENNARIGTRKVIINQSGRHANGKIKMADNAASVVFTYRGFGEDHPFTLGCVQYNAINEIKRENTSTSNTSIYTWNVTSVSDVYRNVAPGLYCIDASGLLVGTYIRVQMFSTESSSIPEISCTVKKGEKEYINIPATYARMYFRVYDTTTYSGEVVVYKVNKNNEIKVPVETMLTGHEESVSINESKSALNKMWYAGGAIASGGRIAAGLFTLTGTFDISISDYTNYKFAVVQYNYDTQEYVAVDSGWITSGSLRIINDFNRVFGVTLAKVSGSITSLSEMENIGLTITPVGYYYEKIATRDEIDTINERLGSAESSINSSAKTNLAVFSGRFKPCYDHLFVNKTGENVIIPHESIYHVRLSHKMGYNTIEANVSKTSDNVYFVNHLNGGKFGGYFHHVDGVTDISDISASSVTWDWIVENVRYNSTIPKYRTRPCTLQEFLAECKQQDIIPFATSSDSNVIKIVEGIMGKENYIAYNATRANAPNAIIYHWVSNLTTKSAILEYCKSVGAPFIYGMGNPTDFTDDELKDIVDTLHENGFWIGTSYADDLWYKYAAFGFDFNGSQSQINRIESGNLYNINSVFGFNDFVIDGGTETNGEIVFSSSGTIRPNIADDVESVVCVDIEVWFTGTITLGAIGERSGAQTVQSDGSLPFFVCTPILNGSPKFTLSCASGTTIKDIKFKVSVC